MTTQTPDAPGWMPIREAIDRGLTYDVIAPETPGARPTIIASVRTLSQARLLAERHVDRRDLRRQDVRITRGGRQVEYAGPPR